MTRPKRDRVIRVGDRVKIVTPKRFIRCGYLHDMEFYKNLLAPLAVDIEALVVKARATADMAARPPFFTTKPYPQLLQALAYQVALDDSFGGADRTIHEEDVPEWQDLECTVSGISTVVTGTRCSGGYCGGSYYDNDEYEPPSLDDQKRWRILDLCGYGAFRRLRSSDYLYPENPENNRIRASYCEKLPPRLTDEE